MAQQGRPRIILASLTLAGGSRYPSALGHLVRTAAVAAYLANVLELDDAEQRRIYLVAPVHDIGKLGIPDDVLLKPASLTDAEQKVMQRHSDIGADLLAGTPDPVLQLAASVARHHHEHFDGSGYPGGLAGDDVPLAARVVSIADAFDAMLEPRVYRQGMSEDDALDALADQSGRYFDPALMDCFLKNVSGVRRARAAAESLVQQYGDVSGVIRFYGARGESPSFLRYIQTLG
ncbi:HD-GYP domain-containing protein [Ralstonia sp. Ralssp135]|uniref:HD-GYP domain-containing protein n=1 Tax=Ralstonia sp. Ralssp135 TaxID=3243016 RepID=UPI0039AEBA0E